MQPILRPGSKQRTTGPFALPPGFVGAGEVEVSATLLYRRGWRALAVTKGWTVDAHGGPIETEVARDELAVPVFGATTLEAPASRHCSYAALVAFTRSAAQRGGTFSTYITRARVLM